MPPTHVAMCCIYHAEFELFFLSTGNCISGDSASLAEQLVKMNVRMKHRMKRPTNRCIHAWILEND